MEFKPSVNQSAIYDAVDNTIFHLLIAAVAGSGKTTTIVEIAKRLPPGLRVIFLAFNRDIVKELRTKLPQNVEVKTLHAFGMNELRFKFGNLPGIVKEKFVDDSKISHIIMAMADTWGPFAKNPDEEEADKMSHCSRVEKLVDLMRMCLPQSREELNMLAEEFDIQTFDGEIEHAKQVLLAARKVNTCFDFVDMIYRPAIGDWRLKQYDYVIVDECQDLNRAQQTMIKKMVKPGTGRMIAVGDPFQAIYGFAGADINSYNNLKNLFPNTKEMPLSVCYRCATDIVEHAQEIVSHIEARPGAEKGEVRQGSMNEIADGDFVLCRNTRPLVSLCMKFIAQGKKATIKGGDIGKNLINLIRNTRSKTIESMFHKLDKEYQKLLEKAREQYPLRLPEEVAFVANMDDKISAIRSISKERNCKNTQDIIENIERIFTDEVSGIVLSTMHKAKGLEAANVFILEKFRLPAPYATREGEIAQEKNLDYVSRTRAKKKLIYINDYVSDELKRPMLKSSLSKIKI